MTIINRRQTQQPMLPSGMPARKSSPIREYEKNFI